MEAGLAPRELAPFIAGAPLTALNKQGGGLRPIAIGETIGALFPSVAVRQPLRIARLYLAHFKWELRLKVVRRPRCMRLGDWKKNLETTQARSCSRWIFPTLSTKWTGRRCWRKCTRSCLGFTAGCYSASAHLFFGTCLLASMAGVQQGDTLGPLLFSLVLHPLVLKIQQEFPNLLLNVWY